MEPSQIVFPTQEQVPDNARVDASAWSMKYLVDGEIKTWNGPGADVLSPVCYRSANGELVRAVVGQTPKLDADEAMRALHAARAAWDNGRGRWPSMRVASRIEATEKFVGRMIDVREPVVRLLMWEIGKPRKDAESEFDRTVAYIRDTIEELKEVDRESSRFVMEEGHLGQIRRSPFGVVLCMGPFNYPLNETFTTLIPALIMGNTVVSKLPKHGALLHAPLFEAFKECFPPGVINIIQGEGSTVVGPIMQSGGVDVLAFIGTSRVANAISKQHPRLNRLRLVTGLEAKNPGVVLPDADLDVAVRECVGGSLTFNGQRCTAIKLLFVHEQIAEQFLARFCAAVDALKAGMPWEPGVQVTPLPEANKAKTLDDFVQDALAKGARIVNGGGQSVGTFYRPAVVYPVTPDMRLYAEEQFGPVVPVIPFRDDSEIDAFMQHSPYGQQISLFGREPQRLGKLIDALVNQVARINLNTQCRRGPDTFPFTGRKDSAEGTLSVRDALRAFSIRTVVATNLDPANKAMVSDIVSGRRSAFLSTDYIL